MLNIEEEKRLILTRTIHASCWATVLCRPTWRWRYWIQKLINLMDEANTKRLHQLSVEKWFTSHTLGYYSYKVWSKSRAKFFRIKQSYFRADPQRRADKLTRPLTTLIFGIHVCQTKNWSTQCDFRKRTKWPAGVSPVATNILPQCIGLQSLIQYMEPAQKRATCECACRWIHERPTHNVSRAAACYREVEL